MTLPAGDNVRSLISDTGYRSYAEPGTGELIVDEIVSMLHELRGSP